MKCYMCGELYQSEHQSSYCPHGMLMSGFECSSLANPTGPHHELCQCYHCDCECHQKTEPILIGLIQDPPPFRLLNSSIAQKQ